MCSRNKCLGSEIVVVCNKNTARHTHTRRYSPPPTPPPKWSLGWVYPNNSTIPTAPTIKTCSTRNSQVEKIVRRKIRPDQNPTHHKRRSTRPTMTTSNETTYVLGFARKNKKQGQTERLVHPLAYLVDTSSKTHATVTAHRNGHTKYENLFYFL